MNRKYEHFKKRYNLEIVEKDGEIVEIYAITQEGKLPYTKEKDGWMLKQTNSVMFLPF